METEVLALEVEDKDEVLALEVEDKDGKMNLDQDLQEVRTMF